MAWLPLEVVVPAPPIAPELLDAAPPVPPALLVVELLLEEELLDPPFVGVQHCSLAGPGQRLGVDV